MNNFEKTKAMTIEEMAEFLWLYVSCCDFCPNTDCKTKGDDCENNFKQWLESEAE